VRNSHSPKRRSGTMTKNHNENLSRRVLKARRWARVAGAEAMDAYGNVESERKGSDRELVTERDRSIERFLRERIKSTFPDDRVVGEEFEPQRTGGEMLWYLDPIDGTAAYSMALPIWTVCMGIARDVEPLAGVMWAPAVEDEYFGGSQGAFSKNNAELRDRAIPPDTWDDESLLCIRSDTHRNYTVNFQGKCRSLGSSAYHMGLVLDGRAVGALLGKLHAWDVAAACGLSSDSGFELVSLSGNRPDWNNLASGEYSREPLIFSHEKNINELQTGIERRNS